MAGAAEQAGVREAGGLRRGAALSQRRGLTRDREVPSNALLDAQLLTEAGDHDGAEAAVLRTLAVNQLNQRYELPWNVKDDAGNTVGDGPYVARASVTYEDGTSTIQTAAVVVAK